MLEHDVWIHHLVKVIRFGSATVTFNADIFACLQQIVVLCQVQVRKPEVSEFKLNSDPRRVFLINLIINISEHHLNYLVLMLLQERCAK